MHHGHIVAAIVAALGVVQYCQFQFFDVILSNDGIVIIFAKVKFPRQNRVTRCATNPQRQRACSFVNPQVAGTLLELHVGEYRFAVYQNVHRRSVR